MIRRDRRLVAVVLALVAAGGLPGCRGTAPDGAADGRDGPVTTLGTVEVTARLVDVPAGTIVRRDLYDYAGVMKYEVLAVHRGAVPERELYVAHYNPFKPRAEAADRKVKGIGGTVRSFEVGQVHRLALEVPLDEHFMGGLINKYYGQSADPLYWAVWTNAAER